MGHVDALSSGFMWITTTGDSRSSDEVSYALLSSRVRASTMLTEAAKALATRDHVRGISGLSALSNIILDTVLSFNISY